MPRDDGSPPSVPSDWAAAAELAPMIEMWRQLLKDHVPNSRGRCQACTQGEARASRRRGGRAARAGSPKRPPSVTHTAPADRLAEHGSNTATAPGSGSLTRKIGSLAGSSTTPKPQARGSCVRRSPVEHLKIGDHLTPADRPALRQVPTAADPACGCPKMVLTAVDLSLRRPIEADMIGWWR